MAAIRVDARLLAGKNNFTPAQQLQQRAWLMHWSLFIFFNHSEVEWRTWPYTAPWCLMRLC